MEDCKADEFQHCLEKCETGPDSSSSTNMTLRFLHSQPHPLRRRICCNLAKLLLGIAAVLGIWVTLNNNSKALPSASKFYTGGIEEGSAETNVPSFPRPTLQFHPNNCKQPKQNNETHDTGVDDSYYCFKILQIADIHLGEAEDLDWGPEQDRKTWIVLDSVIQSESPDLIILSGDQLTGNNCKENATAYYQMLGKFLTKYDTPWATIFGNHDDLGFVDPETGKESRKAKYSRIDLMKVDQSFPLSLSQAGPSDVFGTSNYVLDIFHDTDANGTVRSSVAAQIFLLDTGGGSLPEVIDETHLRWFDQHEGNQEDSNIPAVAFQHIPTLSHEYSRLQCTGENGDNGMNPLESDAGIVSALLQAKRFLFLAVGHNHGNDYCCPYEAPSTTGDITNHGEISPGHQAFHLCFGRHSGYGGYGKWERGARVYELKLKQGAEQREISWKSWVRLESGDVVDSV